jgi:hypothetical protein
MTSVIINILDTNLNILICVTYVARAGAQIDD